MGATIGVDIGDTHISVVLVRNGDIYYGPRIRVQEGDLTSRIVEAIKDPLEKCGRLKNFNVGTTHLLNAILQKKDLNKVRVIRLSLPLTDALPPLSDWAKGTVELVKDVHVIDGGYEYNGTEYRGLNIHEIEGIASNNDSSVAITGVFSPLKTDHEDKVAAIFRRGKPDLGVSLSSQFGDLGLLRRENATILNTLILDKYANLSNYVQNALTQLQQTIEASMTLGEGTKRRITEISES